MNNNHYGGFGYSVSGILTYDGVHPTTLGNNLLADSIAEGIYQSLSVPEPTSFALLALGSLVLLCRRQSTQLLRHIRP